MWCFLEGLYKSQLCKKWTIVDLCIKSKKYSRIPIYTLPFKHNWKERKRKGGREEGERKRERKEGRMKERREGGREETHSKFTQPTSGGTRIWPMPIPVTGSFMEVLPKGGPRFWERGGVLYHQETRWRPGDLEKGLLRPRWHSPFLPVHEVYR